MIAILEGAMIMERAREPAALFPLYTNWMNWFGGQCDMMTEFEKHQNKCYEILEEGGESHLMAYYGI